MANFNIKQASLYQVFSVKSDFSVCWKFVWHGTIHKININVDYKLFVNSTFTVTYDNEVVGATKGNIGKVNETYWTDGLSYIIQYHYINASFNLMLGGTPFEDLPHGLCQISKEKQRENCIHWRFMWLGTVHEASAWEYLPYLISGLGREYTKP